MTITEKHTYTVSPVDQKSAEYVEEIKTNYMRLGYSVKVDNDTTAICMTATKAYSACEEEKEKCQDLT